MSIISNEHQSGSPFDSEQEPSEPGCICGRGVRCPLHGGPDGIELPGVLSFLRENFVNDGAEGESVHRLCALAERMAAELRTLRARVGELESETARLLDENEQQHSTLCDETNRAESAEARVAELEKLFDDAGQGEHNVLALIDHYQSEAMAESEARRAALARVGELECAEADLESQLAAATQAARARVEELEAENARLDRFRQLALADVEKARLKAEQYDRDWYGLRGEFDAAKARADSAEARVKELERVHAWKVIDLETMIQNEHKLYADAHERMLKAEARVKELEQDDKELSDQLQLNAEELYRQIARAESAEARVKELEDKAAGYLHAFKDGCVRSEERITELECQRDLAQDEARALNEKRAELRATIRDLEARAESAEARVKELEIELLGFEVSARKRNARITDLESQLAAARESECWHAFKLEERSDELIKLRARAGELEQCVADLEYELKAAREEHGLEAKLGDRFPHIRIVRWSVEWRHDKLGNFFANAKTLPALLRAILDTEEKPR